MTQKYGKWHFNELINHQSSTAAIYACIKSVFFRPHTHVLSATCVRSRTATRPPRVYTNAPRLLPWRQRAETLGGSRSVASLYLPFTETAAEAVTSEEPQGPEKVQLQSGGGGGDTALLTASVL